MHVHPAPALCGLSPTLFNTLPLARGSSAMNQSCCRSSCPKSWLFVFLRCSTWPLFCTLSTTPGICTGT